MPKVRKENIEVKFFVIYLKKLILFVARENNRKIPGISIMATSRQQRKTMVSRNLRYQWFLLRFITMLIWTDFKGNYCDATV